MDIITLIFTAIVLVANWRIFEKMGRQGWESLIPFYNAYIAFQLLYGNGAKMFLLLIPFYNIYVYIKFCIDLADKFNLSTAFGWGLALLSPIFSCLLAFGDAQYHVTI